MAAAKDLHSNVNFESCHWSVVKSDLFFIFVDSDIGHDTCLKIIIRKLVMSIILK